MTERAWRSVFRWGARFFGHRRFRDDDRGGPQQATPQSIPLAELLDDLAFRHVGGLLLRNGFVQMGIERLALRVHFLQTGLGQRGFELLVDHRDAGVQGVCGVGLSISRGGKRHVEMIEHGKEFLDQSLVGELDSLVTLAGSALLEIFKVRRGAQQPVPMFVGLGRADFQLVKFFGRQWRWRSGCRRLCLEG